MYHVGGDGADRGRRLEVVVGRWKGGVWRSEVKVRGACLEVGA
jgi:hypothetical protein